jgi:hypothetical protein
MLAPRPRPTIAIVRCALPLVACLVGGCTTRSASEGANASATAPGAPWPLCGVLSDGGYAREGELTFLVPPSLGGHEVVRHNVVDATGAAMPLAAYAGWWFCITRGTIQRLPSEEHGEPIYGLIEVEEFVIDQSTGERGQE